MMIYQGENWPAAYRDKLMTLNLHGRRTNVEAIERVGSALVMKHQPDILGMSALLTTTMPYMKVVIDTLKEKGMRNDYIVLVGGAPVNMSTTVAPDGNFASSKAKRCTPLCCSRRPIASSTISHLGCARSASA